MKKFFTVLKFELMNYYKSKSFLISTLVMCVIIAVVLSIPTIKGTFFEDDDVSEADALQYGIVYNESEILKDHLENNFYAGVLKEYESQEDMEEEIKSGDIEAGFVLGVPGQYEYVVENKEMIDQSQVYFEEALTRAIQINGLEALGYDYQEVSDIISPVLVSDTVILGKDSESNYFYTYALVFVLYFMVVVYGQMIATSIASEKSNRAMEVLITSTDAENLIFGKVIAGALAGVTQFGGILALSKVFYNLNAEAWENRLDFLFEIPIEVILTFSVFGILGYLFYSFIYGALGALVSRIEDVSSSSAPITIIFIGVFFIAMTGMYNTEGMMMKVTSYIPFSSFMSMFIRVSMGTVSSTSVIISLVILAASTVVVGILASKIYRLGTLMYGNPVKLRHAIKLTMKK